MRAPTRTTTTRGPASAIVILLAFGLALRVIIAYQLPGSGFGVDLNAFRFWADDLARSGPSGFYERGFFADYTPGYLYVLWLVGLVGNVLGGIGDLIKVPAILADLALAWLVHAMVLELGGSRRSALVGAAVVLFAPITWFDSVVWGQVDSVGAVVLLLGLRELWRDRPERATFFATLAAVVKPQLGILVPIAAAVLLRRFVRDAWRGRSGAAGEADGSAAAPEGARSDALFDRLGRGPVRIVSSLAVGLLTAVALSAPFGLSFTGLIGQVVETAGGYPWLTVNAYNPWALVTDGGAGLAATGAWLRDVADPETGAPAVLIAGLPAVVVGTALLLAAIAAIVGVVARRPDRVTILVALAAIAIVFFVVPTRVHERYLYPFFAVGAILAAVSARWATAYAVLTLANFFNLYVVLTTLYPDNPSIQDWLGIGSWIRSPGGVTIVALVHLGGFAWVAWQLRAEGRRRIADEIAAGAASEAAAHPTPGPARYPAAGPAADGPPSAAVPGAAADAGLARLAVAVDSAPVGAARLDALMRRPAPDDPGLLAAFRRRALARPLRPDRSPDLAGEPGGRIDRLDVWLLVVLVVATLALRTFRLAEPYEMHFDEVYHARTATEFLQDWRYGQPHAIYEYTHPHLAKYAMAAGLVAFGNDRVTATSELGVPVRDALIEPRWDDPGATGGRSGDRVWVATGTEVRGYDLGTRRPVATLRLPAPDAVALALDPAAHRLLVATSAGGILTADTTPLDAIPAGTAIDVPATALVDVGAPVRQLLATDDGAWLVAVTQADELVSVDLATGAVVGRLPLTGIGDLAGAGTGEALVARPLEVADPAAASAVLAAELGGAASEYEARLATDAGQVVIAAAPAQDVRTALEAAIADGRLAGFSFASLPRIAVTDADGVALVSPAGPSLLDRVDLGAPATGLALVTSLDEPKLYVASGTTVRVVGLGDDAGAAPGVESTIDMPGAVRDVTVDPSSEQVHVLGRTPEDEAATVYVIEPNGNAVYADTRLPFEPVAWVTDASRLYPAADRQEVLAFDGDGSVAAVDVGSHAFAWRLPGVIAGGLLSACLYLLARILFRRRSVAVLAGVLSLLDGMFFVQSRIAMNDVYVGAFLAAAFTLFAAIWTGAWRGRWAFWLGMPVVGLLLGLALSSKWVALYAIAAIGMLVLARSALGRVVVVAALVAATTVLGYLAVSVPAGATSNGNLTFMLIMIGLTLAAVLVTVLHPIAWTVEEVRFAVGAPVAAGLVILAVALPLGRANGTVVALAFGLALLGGVAAAAFRVAARWGYGPLAPPPAAEDPVRLLEPPAPAPTGWLRLGSGFGLPAVWLALSLLALPVAVYVASYLPWVALGNRLTETWPPGNSGQTLLDLTRSMYEYHDNLRATHAASSPWWAWPFDLKPVWFFQGGFAGGTAGAIYDAGNLVVWWLAVPAMAFTAWQALRRRSLALGLVVVGFAWMWLSWSRIDRATFQYHYYTSLPFLVLALAYFLAELWHGASLRTWLLARLAAATAVLGPALLWLLRGPLCGFVGVERVNAGSEACVALPPGELVLTARTLGIVLVMGAAAIALIYQLIRLDEPEPEPAVVSGLDPDPDPDEAAGRRIGPRYGGPVGAWPFRLGRLGRLALTAGAAAVGAVAAGRVLGEDVLVAWRGFPPEAIALVVLIPLGAMAWFIVTARDARRFVGGAIFAALAWFLAFYPNISGLPLPSTVVNSYQGLLPTYLYPFQFPVNTDPAGAGPRLLAPEPAVLFVALALTAIVVGYSASVWRVALAERRLAPATGDAGPATGGDAGPATGGDAGPATGDDAGLAGDDEATMAGRAEGMS